MPVIVTDENVTKLRVDNVMDLVEERPMNLIHGQRVFRVAGFNMVLSDEGAAAFLQNAFFSAGYLMAASIVALKCLNLVPDLAAWMIPEGDTAFSTRNFGEGVASQAKTSAMSVMR